MENEEDRKPKKTDKTPSHTRWVIRVFLIAVSLSAAMSLCSGAVLEDAGYLVATLILLLFILLGILFDIIGVAVTAANPKPFNSMAAHRVKGAKEALYLIRNAEKVASFCNDVVGDICGIVSGSTATVIVVLLVVAILLGNSSLFYTARPALQVGDVKYSSAEVNYAYRTAYLSFCNQYSSILSSIGFDTKKPLDEQKCTISEEFDTWDDYFKNAAKQNLVQVTALCDAAKKAGITLDEDDQHEVDEQFSYIELSAKQYKYSSVSKYLQAVYGNGVTKKVARHMLELSQLASKYSQQQYDSYTYTDEQIAENYAENKNSYDVFNYQYYLVQAATEETTGADGNTSTATTDATMAAAKATADKIAAATHFLQTRTILPSFSTWPTRTALPPL